MTNLTKTQKCQPKPIWKSVSLWIGVSITLFLFWVWVDSQTSGSMLRLGTQPRQVQLTVRDSYLVVGTSFPDESKAPSVPGSEAWAWRRWYPGRNVDSQDAGLFGWFKPWRSYRIATYDRLPSSSPSGAATVSILTFEGDKRHIPFWIVFVVWLLVWLWAFRFYRQTLRKRAVSAAFPCAIEEG